MAPPSVAEIAIDRGLLMKELLSRLKVTSDPRNTHALVALNVALNDILAVAQRRCSATELDQKRRQQLKNADDIFPRQRTQHG